MPPLLSALCRDRPCVCGVRCVYELYESLVGGNHKTYDMYTALDHVYEKYGGGKYPRGAVGIADGLAACDNDASDASSAPRISL